MSARKSFFFAFCARARAQWDFRDWSDITRKKMQVFSAAPPKRPSQKALSARKSFFFAFCARARAMGGSRLVGHYAQEDARFRRPPPRNGRRRSPCLRESLFFSRFARARARAMGGSRTGRTLRARRRKVSAPPPRNGRCRSPCLRRKSFFFAFCARARNGRFETGRTLRARRRKVKAPPPRNGRRRRPCLRESLFFSRLARARAQWEVRDWSDILRKKTQG